jgi:hypothetical protein
MKTIKHWLTLSLFLAFAAFGMAGCDNDVDDLEDVGDEIGDAADEAGDEIEDAVE